MCVLTASRGPPSIFSCWNPCPCVVPCHQDLSLWPKWRRQQHLEELVIVTSVLQALGSLALPEGSMRHSVKVDPLLPVTVSDDKLPRHMCLPWRPHQARAAQHTALRLWPTETVLLSNWFPDSPFLLLQKGSPTVSTFHHARIKQEREKKSFQIMHKFNMLIPLEEVKSLKHSKNMGEIYLPSFLNS